MKDEKQQRKKERCEERESWRDVKTGKVRRQEKTEKVRIDLRDRESEDCQSE
jgi:hypothetical protein